MIRANPASEGEQARVRERAGCDDEVREAVCRGRDRGPATAGAGRRPAIDAHRPAIEVRAAPAVHRRAGAQADRTGGVEVARLVGEGDRVRAYRAVATGERRGHRARGRHRHGARTGPGAVSYTHLTLPTSDLV